MSKERIGKTLIILDEDEARKVQWLALQAGNEAIYLFVKEIIAKRVEAALRMRCG